MKENLIFSKQIQKLKEQLESKGREQNGNYSFNELVEILKEKKFKVPIALAF